MVQMLQIVFTWIAIVCGVGVFILVVDGLAYVGEELWSEWQQEKYDRKDTPNDTH